MRSPRASMIVRTGGLRGTGRNAGIRGTQASEGRRAFGPEDSPARIHASRIEEAGTVTDEDIMSRDRLTEEVSMRMSKNDLELVDRLAKENRLNRSGMIRFLLFAGIRALGYEPVEGKPTLDQMLPKNTAP